MSKNIATQVFIGAISPIRHYMFNEDLQKAISVVWNTSKDCLYRQEKEDFVLKKDEIIFLTEKSNVSFESYDCLNVLQFSRDFYCVEENDSDVGCNGVLFFNKNELKIPKIKLSKDNKPSFEILWKTLLMEIDEFDDDLKKEMMQLLLKRFLILSLRVYKSLDSYVVNDDQGIGIIREFNYLVEKHFKSMTKVVDYAKVLHRSPKTLSNVFAKYIDKTPLQIINDRRFLEAKKMLISSERSIQSISDELGFADIQSFSHFFRNRAKVSPSKFRG